MVLVSIDLIINVIMLLFFFFLEETLPLFSWQDLIVILVYFFPNRYVKLLTKASFTFIIKPEIDLNSFGCLVSIWH